ncbi:MAG: copper amine oxidase N-terminal domain-containing protein, partial [Syntrophomonadaceae bacterium]|nr:copper amine oxidase N-terminal domain-containing protein [Syntrophomonadaceae bacterium]
MRFIQKVTMILITGLLLTLIIKPVQSGMAADSIRIFIDNREIAAEVQPVIVNDRTMVPLRVISENLGMTVDWDEDTRSVFITSPGKFIPGEYIDRSLSDSNNISIFLDGVYIESEVKPFIKNDRTMVPLRVISEGMGMKVNWDGKERLVSVNSPAPVLPSRNENVPVPTPVPEPVEDLPEEIPADSQLLNSLASYKTNLKLMDGSVLNSADLLNRCSSDFSPEQLSAFRTFLSQLSKYEALIRLPDGSMVNNADVTIMGEAYLTAEQLTRWIRNETPRLMEKARTNGREFKPIPDLADLYIRIGAEYGVRGDIAYCQ